MEKEEEKRLNKEINLEYITQLFATLMSGIKRMPLRFRNESKIQAKIKKNNYGKNNCK